LVTEKTTRYTNKNLDLNQLGQQIVDYLNADGWGTQKGKTKGSDGVMIEARKENILRDLITADRALTILIQGQPNDFTVRVGIGRWVQNLTVAVVEAVLTAGAFLVVDVPEMVWNREIEYKIMHEITRIIEGEASPKVTA
jgi:hypothetical protein